MASYTVSNYTIRYFYLNVGEPFGFIPFCAVVIADSWADEINLNDTITLPSGTVLEDLRVFNSTFPSVISPGGSQSQFNSSTFKNYTYPLTSEGNFHVKVSRTWFSSTANLVYQFYIPSSIEGYFTSDTLESNRSNGRVGLIAILMTDDGEILNFFRVDITNGGNSFTSIADNNGLGYGCVNANSTIYQGNTVTVKGKVNWLDLEYYDPAIETDPYTDGGESAPDGGNGNFTRIGNDVDFDPLPTVSAVDTGFLTIYNPSAAQLKNLATYMWTNPLFDLENWKKLFADPMDAIIGLSLIPVAIPSSGSRSLVIGNIDTGVTLTLAASQWVQVNCGSVHVAPYWKAYLDYDPYTQIEIALPYIGTKPLRSDDVIGKTLTVKYNIDILSGACVCEIMCSNASRSSVLYRYMGSCATQVPITGQNWNNIITGVLTTIGGMAASYSGSSVGALMSAGNAANSITDITKPHIERSGAVSGSGGLMGNQKPYLIFTFPRQCLPAGQKHFIGYPSYITEFFTDLRGYTEIDSVHLEGIPATDSEIAEIETLLKGGVIF